MAFAIKFGSLEEAATEGSLLRDGWGSKINTAVSGDTVYVEGDDPQMEKIKDWYPDNPPKLVDPPEDVVKMLHGADESNTAGKTWKVRVEFDLLGNREFTHMFTHADNAKEAAKNAIAFVEREYGGTNIAVADTEEVIPTGKSESFDEKLSYEKEVVWSTDQYEANGADEDPYTVYSLDDETGRVSKDGVYPTWRKAYAALADGTVWDEGSSNNFVFHGNHLQQIYKYKKTGRTGKWSGNGYDVIFDREISEDPADYIKAHFTPTRYNACRFNEAKGADETIEYEKGHKNSRGEDAPWVIRSHEDDRVLASFPTKKEAENHMKTMKRYSKTEGKFTEIKAAIKAAWSAAEVKWFRLDFREYQERLNVYPIVSDNEGVGVNWGVLPERNLIVQYATAFRAGKSDDEREIPYKDLDELEKIFTDEFKAMDETLEIGAENGADIHPITETAPDDYARDNFLEGALDYAEIEDDNGNITLLKFYKSRYGDDFKLDSYDGENEKTLAAGGLRYVVDRYGELLDMDPAEAIIEIAKE